MINEFLISSKCATAKEEKEYLFKLLGNKRLITTMLYCGSLHGWKAVDFHSRCDNKGPTIVLFKIKDGDCIGGYTKAKWSSPHDGIFIEDSYAILFNMTSCRNFPSIG
jgi:hypothetical protein